MNKDDWNARYAAAERVWSEEPNRFLVEEVASLTPGRALDLACGEGRNAIWLAGRGWRVDAIDYSSTALDRARQTAAERDIEVNWIEGDVESPLSVGPDYDLVLVFYLQLPWASMKSCIKRAAAAVAPGGTFLLVGHDRRNLEHGYGGPKSADVLYTPADVAKILTALAIVEADRRQRPVETDDGGVLAIDCLVRAVAPI